MITLSIENTVLDILERITEKTELRENPDVALFDEHILDSFDLMLLIAELSEAFEVEISPAEVDRAAWATPRKIVAYLQARLGRE
jgi:D-alanine--poly(phosphoribitol) ligase subunit 2